MYTFCMTGDDSHQSLRAATITADVAVAGNSKSAVENRPARILIPVAQLEFNEGGNTVWVHSPLGGTVLRIKCTGSIKVSQCENSPVSHSDIMVAGDIDICVSKDAERE